MKKLFRMFLLTALTALTALCLCVFASAEEITGSCGAFANFGKTNKDCVVNYQP